MGFASRLSARSPSAGLKLRSARSLRIGMERIRFERSRALPSSNRLAKEGTMRNRKSVIAPALFLIGVAPCFAADRAPIEGTWRLVSFEREYRAVVEREFPMGKSPTGYIVFLPEGRMAVVITGDGRKAPTTDQDRAELYNSLVAYTGKYRVDGDKWITTVDVSANPAWVGTEQTRTFRVTGDRLQEMTVWFTRPDNRMARAVITYERAK
jgi:Lipocalin-like domain